MYTLNYLLQHRLKPEFFNQNTLTVAQKFLGKYLVSNKNGILKVGQIVETEAYIGTNDLACHASHSKTPRNKIMWDSPGFVYVYLVYGLHHLINIITEPEGSPAAVLIRALKPIQNISSSTDGPGKLTKALNIDKFDHGLNILNSDQLFISDLGEHLKKIQKLPRVGINYAGEPWISKPWRFLAS
jgi:DNA-3-methyladenine glycosylase